MKHLKEQGVKAKVVVTLTERTDEDADTVVLYRGGRNGLAFRSPSHRVLRHAVRVRGRGDAAVSGAQASAAALHQQGGA